jgi:hypothetical protein
MNKSSAMTKHNDSRRRKQVSFIDRLFRSFSLEFWISLATVAVAADFIFKFGTTSLIVTIIWTAVLGFCAVMTNQVASKTFQDFNRAKIQPNLKWGLLSLGVLFVLLCIGCMTDPAHALIINKNGETEIKNLLSGQGLSSGTAGTGLGAFATMVITGINVFFAITAIFALKGAYDKYNERTELTEIIQAPVVLIIVILAIDGVCGLIFTTAG